MIWTFGQVALGGAIGASLRFGVGVAVARVLPLGTSGFPVAVLLCNVVGSALMGAFVTLSAARGLTHLAPLLMTGLLGGFTTFSSFSLEAVTLWERGATGQAALYVGISLGLSLLGLVLGAALMRGALA
ncbi:CrcB family protein [Tropicimonas sp. IMCC34011]|uniref:fluoride efflux transporter FluC n=1 Tax=Tropicimonas sp. IMCC34011 TaxID=2248759 RepID=UPI000E25E90E|nr:CrcB family protein [Tropicimonas sp. IMCC34011]